MCLTIGPIFLSGAIYLCLARIIVAYGAHLSRFQPRVYTIGFICCDLLSLALQAAGGGITSYATTEKKHKHGVNIMVTGLSLQVFSLVVFIVCCGDFASRVSRAGKSSLNSTHATLRHSSKFRSFLYGKHVLRCGIHCSVANMFLGLSLATFCILIRSCFRVAELSHGFGSKLANQQVTFMILEGAMIVIASVTLTSLHPGVAFQGSWVEADFTVWHSHKHGVVDESDAERAVNEDGEAETVVVKIIEK